MAAYKYTALDTSGKRKSGFTEAESPKQARRHLRDIGLVPIDVAASETPANETSKSGARLGSNERILLTQLLAALLDSGLPVDDALTAVSNQASHKQLKRVVTGLRSRVLEGYSLEQSLAFFPRAFSTAYASTVGAGEQTRHLPVVLRRLADHLHRQQEITQKLKVAAIYPTVLVVVSILVVGGLLTYVVPEVVKVFADLDQQLPFVTRLLIGVSDFLAQHTLALTAGVVLSVLAAARLIRWRPLRLKIHRVALLLPGIRRFVLNNDGARFARTFSVLLDSGVNIVPALQICSRSAANLYIQEALMDAAERVHEGEALTAALSDSELFPPLLIHLIANGERSGELSVMLDTAAATQERELETQISIVLGLVEPLLILIMGGIVFTIVLGILLPIFDMNQLI